MSLISLPVLATTAALLSVAYSARFVHDIFFNGQPVGLDRIPHEPPRYMRIPMEVLVALCILVGLFPQFVVGDVLQLAAAAALQGPPPEYSLSLWHGLNVPLLMSVLAFVGGSDQAQARRHPQVDAKPPQRGGGSTSDSLFILKKDNTRTIQSEKVFRLSIRNQTH